MELNIFTDASITKTIYGETIGCAGAVCLELAKEKRYEILRDSTNNISEITAIKLAVQMAIDNRDWYDRFNILSDSQWSVFGLTKWNRSWMNNMDNYMMKNSSGENVKNQEIFLAIMKMIVNNDININFFHVKGHVDPHNIKSINNATSVFQKSNGVSVSRNTVFTIAQMNNYVDNTTRNMLEDFKNVPPEYYKRGIINPILSKEDLNTYYKLVTLGGNQI